MLKLLCRENGSCRQIGPGGGVLVDATLSWWFFFCRGGGECVCGGGLCYLCKVGGDLRAAQLQIGEPNP